MINKEINLNSKIFEREIDKEPIRKGYGEGLLEVGKSNKDVVALCADLTGSTKTNMFADEFPDRFIQIGVAEQNLAAVASGVAAMGKIPFITSYAMFSPGRNWEQIRTTICYNDQPVKIAGSHAGVSVGPDGGTHQAIEDIAITRVIPRMVVLSPCDVIEAKKATKACVDTKTPVYIRLARNPSPVITTEDTPFQLGKGQVFFDSDIESEKKVAIIATGALVHKALLAAQELEKEGIAVRVINISTIKPLDEDLIIKTAKDFGAIVSVEEHQQAGGLGSAISEVLTKNWPVPMEFVGVDDKFGQSGEPENLVEHYGLGKDAIKEKSLKVLNR